MMKTISRPNPATDAKKRWNAKNYTQIKAHIDPETASAFKAACAAAGVSMASVLTRFMQEYSDVSRKRVAAPTPDYSTRGRRRAAVRSFAGQMGMILAAEEQCRDNTPENLRGSIVYEEADEYVAQLEEVAELLSSIY